MDASHLPLDLNVSLVPLLEEIQVFMDVLTLELQVFLVLVEASVAQNAISLYLLQLLQKQAQFFYIFYVVLDVPFHAVDVAEHVVEIKTYILLVLDMNVVLKFESGNSLHCVVGGSEVVHGAVFGRLGQEHGGLDLLHLRVQIRQTLLLLLAVKSFMKYNSEHLVLESLEPRAESRFGIEERTVEVDRGLVLLA